MRGAKHGGGSCQARLGSLPRAHLSAGWKYSPTGWKPGEQQLLQTARRGLRRAADAASTCKWARRVCVWGGGGCADGSTAANRSTSGSTLPLSLRLISPPVVVLNRGQYIQSRITMAQCQACPPNPHPHPLSGTHQYLSHLEKMNLLNMHTMRTCRPGSCRRSLSRSRSPRCTAGRCYWSRVGCSCRWWRCRMRWRPRWRCPQLDRRGRRSSRTGRSRPRRRFGWRSWGRARGSCPGW